MLITKDILLKELGEKEGYNINDKFKNRLKDRIYSWYVDVLCKKKIISTLKKPRDKILNERKRNKMERLKKLLL